MIAFAQNQEEIDIEDLTVPFQTGVAVYDIATNTYYRYNTEQCETRFSPASTFKIPNSLIGLQTGVLTDTSFIIEYDSIKYPIDPEDANKEPYKHWNKAQSLRSAFKLSCVWYYREVAKRIGEEEMRRYIDKLGYGNKDISSGTDNFWLCGSIKISINEQIEILKKLYLNMLDGFSRETMDKVKSLMLYESTENYKLYGKTGYGNCWKDKNIGWYVGFVETKTGPKVFALNLIGSSDMLKDNFRIVLTKRILKKLGFIEY